MIERTVHAMWCDDIRQELGNKPSFMGVYTGGLVVPKVPTLLPRLCVQLWLMTPKERPFKTIGLRVERDDGFALLRIDPTTTEGSIEDIAAKRPGATRQIILAGLSFGGVEIPEGCKYFTVFVETESETLEGLRLYVDVNPEIFVQNGDTFAPNGNRAVPTERD